MQNAQQNKSALSRFGDYSRKYGIVLIFIILVIVAALIQPLFISPRNITNVLRQVAVNYRLNEIS